MATMYAWPSMSISRLRVFSSLVAMTLSPCDEVGGVWRRHASSGRGTGAGCGKWETEVPDGCDLIPRGHRLPLPAFRCRRPALRAHNLHTRTSAVDESQPCAATPWR